MASPTPDTSMATGLATWLPVYFRLMPLLVLFPVPGLDRLPVLVRVFFCLALTVCVGGATLTTDAAIIAASDTGIARYVAEFLLGSALALGVHACFAGLHLGGQLIDTQAGTNATSVFAPGHGGTGVFVEFLTLAVAVSVLLSDTVIVLLARILAHSPATLSGTGTAQLDALLAAFAGNLVAGFLVTFPLVAGLWLMDVIATASSRLLPQANVYFLFLPVKTLFAALLFAASSALLLGAANRVVADALAG